MTELIEGRFNIEFVLEKMLENTKNPDYNLGNLQGYHHKNITNGVAFMSKICRVEFNWKNVDTKPKSVVLKIPEIVIVADKEKAKNEATEFLKHSHSKEILFYKIFSQYKDSLKLAKFYYGFDYDPNHFNGLIIMEDLSPYSTNIPMIPGFTHEQILSIVAELAKFHCISWLYPNWKNYFTKKQLASYPQKTIDFFINIGNELKLIKPEWFTEIIDQLVPYYTISNIANTCYEEDKYGIPASLVHGDLWAANIMFEKDKNGKATNSINSIIDWQTFFCGNSCADLARLLSLNTTAEYRRTNTTKILQYYVEKVTENMDGKALFDLAQIQKAYNYCLPCIALYTHFGAPLYYNMSSIVGEPSDSDHEFKKLELLTRVYKFFQDTLIAIKAYEK